MKRSRQGGGVIGSQILLSTLVGAFLLPTVTFVPGSTLTSGLRFVVVLVVAAMILRKGIRQRLFYGQRVFAAGILFYGLAIFSTAWSGFWPITFLKAGLGGCTLLAGIAQGSRVGFSSSTRNVLAPFAWIGAIWILLTTWSMIIGTAWHPHIALFEGPCDNPNMFASVTAVLAIPTAIALRKYGNRVMRLLGEAGWLISGVVIVMSGSRGGLLIWLGAVALSSVGGTLGRMSSRIVLAGSAIVALLYVLEIAPVEQRVDRVVYKTERLEEERDLFSSRRGPWSMAAQKASEAGFLGAGFGIFPGELPAAMTWLTTVGYGFESGSGWYAVQMQLGIPGLAAYVGVGVALLLGFLGQVRDRDRVRGDLSWTFLGIGIGLYVHSYFEAWIVSPGSPENVLFWSVLGTWIGLRTRQRAGATENRVNQHELGTLATGAGIEAGVR